MTEQNIQPGLATIAAGAVSWVHQMRAAARKCISQEDLEQIVKNQVAAAKKGDKQAIRFVFDQVLGGNEFRGATIVQNNFSGSDELPAAPTAARRGTPRKLDVMSRRAAAGLPIHQDGDGGDEDLT